jgi:hypothetical protein
MYVDDSGSPHPNDDSSHYVISGVIINSLDLFLLEKEVEIFKKKYFVGKFRDEEIHIHDLYGSKGNFSTLIGLREKYHILDALYEMIDSLPLTIISVGINKQRIRTEYPSWDIHHSIWTFMIERYDWFLFDRNVRGTLIVDRSTNIEQCKVTQIINDLILHGSGYQNITNLNNDFYFFPSKTQHAIQVADAVSYCILRTLNKNINFHSYWSKIINKTHKDQSGNIFGVGYKIFPN